MIRRAKRFWAKNGVPAILGLLDFQAIVGVGGTHEVNEWRLMVVRGPDGEILWLEFFLGSGFHDEASCFLKSRFLKFLREIELPIFRCTRDGCARRFKAVILTDGQVFEEGMPADLDLDMLVRPERRIKTDKKVVSNARAAAINKTMERTRKPIEMGIHHLRKQFASVNRLASALAWYQSRLARNPARSAAALRLLGYKQKDISKIRQEDLLPAANQLGNAIVAVRFASEVSPRVEHEEMEDVVELVPDSHVAHYDSDMDATDVVPLPQAGESFACFHEAVAVDGGGELCDYYEHLYRCAYVPDHCSPQVSHTLASSNKRPSQDDDDDQHHHPRPRTDPSPLSPPLSQPPEDDHHPASLEAAEKPAFRATCSRCGRVFAQQWLWARHAKETCVVQCRRCGTRCKSDTAIALHSAMCK